MTTSDTAVFETLAGGLLLSLGYTLSDAVLDDGGRARITAARAWQRDPASADPPRAEE